MQFTTGEEESISRCMSGLCLTLAYSVVLPLTGLFPRSRILLPVYRTENVRRSDAGAVRYVHDRILLSLTNSYILFFVSLSQFVPLISAIAYVQVCF